MARTDEDTQRAVAERVAELLAKAPPITAEQREVIVRALTRRPEPNRNAA